MSVPPVKPTSRQDVVLPVADSTPAPVPSTPKAPVIKSATKKPALSKAATIESPSLATDEHSAKPATRSAKEFNMADTIETMTEKTKTAFAEVNERAKAQMEKSAKAFGDIGAFNKGNVEAIVESSKIAANGFQKLGQDAAVYTKSSYENAVSAFKSMTSVKSPTELFKLQSDFARSSFDAFVAEASRSTEAALKLAGEIAQPISNRVAIAAEKIKVGA